MENTEKKSEPKAIVFQQAEDKIFVTEAWPQFTLFQIEALQDAPKELVALDGDSLTFTAANGTANYLKVEAEEGKAAVFELVESTYAPMSESPIAKIEREISEEGASAEPADTEAEAEAVIEDPELTIDTRAEDEPLPERKPRETFSQAIASEVRAAQARGDMATHAALHNFDMALGDFKRAAVNVLPALSEDGELVHAIRSIVSDL